MQRLGILSSSSLRVAVCLCQSHSLDGLGSAQSRQQDEKSGAQAMSEATKQTSTKAANDEPLWYNPNDWKYSKKVRADVNHRSLQSLGNLLTCFYVLIPTIHQEWFKISIEMLYINQ